MPAAAAAAAIVKPENAGAAGSAAAAPAAIAAMEVPETPNLKWTQHVRGLFTFYERFVGTMDYANRLRSYTDLLVQYNNTGTRISTLFTQEHRENFLAMRQAVLNSMSFFVLDPNKLTYLQTDAASDCQVEYLATLFRHK